MSATVDTLVEPVAPRVQDAPPSHRSAGTRGTLILVLISFLATTVLQHVAQERHHELVKNTGSEAKLSNLNSFSLALLLGGLRGPLVMMLWTSSETQKQDKDLEDFDSKIELIRLLQPEFDSVHIFQMWNLAYNISVQMANKANKYTTILDAIEYGYRIDRQRHDNINIIGAIGQIFFDKLGTSQEKEYYIDRVRRETFPDLKITVPADRMGDLDGILAQAGMEPGRREIMAGQAKRNGYFTAGKLTADAIRPLLSGPGVSYAESTAVVFSETGRRVRLEPMLQHDGAIRPELVAATIPRPADFRADAEWNDGSELQYLKKFAPFPYGISPLGIGWNYYKRCQVLKDSLHQKHLQLSDLVIDNRPAINSMLWGEGEWGTGREAEMRAFGHRLPEAENADALRQKIELPTAEVAPSAVPSDPQAAAEAVYRYDLVTKIAEEALREFARHQGHYAGAEVSFHSHRDSVAAMSALCAGDRDYLKAMLLPAGAGERGGLLKAAARSYAQAARLWELIALKYAVDDQVAQRLYPRGITADNVDTLSTQEVHALTSAINAFLSAERRADSHGDDRTRDEKYYTRAFLRLAQIQSALPER